MRKTPRDPRVMRLEGQTLQERCHSSLAAKNATMTIPVVMIASDDSSG